MDGKLTREERKTLDSMTRKELYKGIERALIYANPYEIFGYVSKKKLKYPIPPSVKCVS
jgi:hypothetical protein